LEVVLIYIYYDSAYYAIDVYVHNIFTATSNLE